VSERAQDLSSGVRSKPRRAARVGDRLSRGLSQKGLSIHRNFLANMTGISLAPVRGYPGCNVDCLSPNEDL
jgi:hypothetical protein